MRPLRPRAPRNLRRFAPAPMSPAGPGAVDHESLNSMRRGWWALIFTVLAFVLGLGPVEAHPGRLDKSGCHNQRGGGFHCHGAATTYRTPARAPVYRPTPATASRPAASGRAPSSSSRAPIARSRAAVAAFRRSNPCPATGRTAGACPGWEVDHVVPLACGGPDTVANMQWLTAQANRSKGAMGCRRR